MKAKELINDRNKQLTLLNRNYFFVVTVLIVAANIVIQAVFGINTDIPTEANGSTLESLRLLLQAFINCYTHFNWQHTLLNMLCFLIAGLYLERKMGSLRFILFIVVLSFFTAFASCVKWDLGGHGFSGVNYGLYGYIIVEFLFELCRKQERYLFNILSGVVILALIYFAMCFNGGTEKVSFAWYPYDLIHNWAHASGFAVGLVFGVYEQLCALISRGKRRRDDMK